MLEARAVSVRVGGRALLDGVSLVVAPGETLAVLGENGAGKTTLLRALAGDRWQRHERLAGDVLLCGRRVHEWPLPVRAGMRAVLPQRPELAFAFTAREVVALGRHAVGTGRGVADERAIAGMALGLADAAHLADRDVTTLSGGELARVHLAAAFAQLWEDRAPHARYLLLDEPTAALDLAHQHHVLATARAFAAGRGIGIVTILHDLNLAAMYADRVLILRDGRTLAQGTPGEVLRPVRIAAGFDVAADVQPHPLVTGMLIATAALRGAR